MSAPEYTDWRHDAVVEIEDMTRRLRALRDRISADVKQDDELFQRIMDGVRASDEAVTGMGTTVPTTGTPCSDLAPGFETATHAFAAIQQSGGCCAEAMDALDDDAVTPPAITPNGVTP